MIKEKWAATLNKNTWEVTLSDRDGEYVVPMPGPDGTDGQKAAYFHLLGLMGLMGHRMPGLDSMPPKHLIEWLVLQAGGEEKP